MIRPTPISRHPRKSGRDDTRRWNLLTALQTIAASGSTSRAEIARATGLTRATVSTLVADLIAAGLVIETGTADQTSAGKPATLLAVNNGSRQIVAVDLSHQPFRAGIIDLGGDLVFRQEAAGPATGPAAIAAVESMIEACLAAATAPVLGIGVATPGILDPDGTIRDSAHLDWHDVPLRQHLSDRFVLPVTVGNDAHLSALAEYRSGADAFDTLLLVAVGEGIGAGLVMNGVLHTGDRLASGEIGHVVVDPEGAECRCGLRGCLETVAAVPAVAGEGDDRAAAARQAGRRLGATLAVVISAIDVNHISLASELTAVDGYVEAVAEELVARMHPVRRPHVNVVASVTTDIGLAGAATAVMRDELGVILR